MKKALVHDFPTPDVYLSHRVSYGETDTMGYVYYAEYFHLFERARSAFIRERGMSYAQIESQGLMLPVRQASCQYKIPSRYDDLITIRAGIIEIRRASLTFVYTITGEEGKGILAQGRTEHACVNLEGKPVPMPTWLHTLMTTK